MFEGEEGLLHAFLTYAAFFPEEREHNIHKQEAGWILQPVCLLW